LFSPPPPPPPPLPALTCSSYSSSAFWRSSRERRLGIRRLQLALGGLHLRQALLQEVRDLLEPLRLIADARREVRDELVHLLAQALLHQRDDDGALVQAVGIHRLAIALQVEGRRDDLAFLLGERADLVLLSATLARLRIRLAEILVQRPHPNEVHVAGAALRRRDRAVVERPREVRDRITGMNVQLFEVQRVAGGDIRHPLAAAEERDHLLRTTVDAVHQLERFHAVVVLGLGLEEHFLDRRRRCVAARLADRHGRRLIGEHVDRILRRRGIAWTVRSVELDPVEAVVIGGEVRGQRAIRLDGQRHLRFVVDENLPAVRGHRRHRPQVNLRAAQDRDVAAVLDLARLESRVGREVVLQLQPLHVRHVGDLERIHRRSHADGLDEVVDRRGQVEERAVVAVVGAADQRQALECRGRRLADHERCLIRLEPHEMGGDVLVGAARDGGVPRFDLDAIRCGRFDAPRNHQQGGERMTHVRGSEQEHGSGKEDNGGERPGVALHRQPLDTAPVLDGAALLDGGFDQPSQQRRR
jgi:hypothetical protein